MSPRLTIAIPTVNRASLVSRAIESALAQTSNEIEIIVSDNGSRDETAQVLARYSDPRLRKFRHDVTVNAARHGEFLINQAQGEFFLGLSDDDYLAPSFASDVLALFDQFPELSFVYTGCLIHYGDIPVPALVGPQVESSRDFILAHYADQRELCWCACVTRVKDLRRFGPQPDDRIIGDMYFWTKIAFEGPVGCVPKPLSNYVLFRSLNDNISHGTSPYHWAKESDLLAKEVEEHAIRTGAPNAFINKLRSASKNHVARSVANQFVWTRIRGASVADAWRWSLECRPFIVSNSLAILRMVAALALPRTLLRRAILWTAKKQADAREGSRCTST